MAAAVLSAIAGLAVSAYAMYVEHQIDNSPGYEAMCDISEGPLKGASCTAVFSSDYGHILSAWCLVPKGSTLDFSNASLAIVFYFTILAIESPLTPATLRPAALLAVSIGGVLFSAYLGYILKTVLKDFCVVCTSMYVINFIIFCFAVARISGWFGLKPDATAAHAKEL